MPLRQPTSPLSFEACLDPAPSLNNDDVIGSDDNLDEFSLAAQHQRIEKLAEAYIQGTPLFILSASLRGPLERDWLNPWRKDRRQAIDSRENNGCLQKDKPKAEKLVIPETTPRKRPQFEVPRSRPRTIPPTPSVANCVEENDAASSISHTRTVVSQGRASGRNARRSPSLHSVDDTWLRKDRVSPRFQNIDPPTSPTASIPSRRRKLKSQTGRVHLTQKRGDIDVSAHINPGSHTSPDFGYRREGTDAPSPGNTCTSESDKQNIDAHPVNPDTSLHIISSSSQLPKFEYRRKRFGIPKVQLGGSTSSDPEDGGAIDNDAAVATQSSSRQVEAHREHLSPNGNLNPQHADKSLDEPQDSLALTNASDTIENLTASNLGRESASNITKGNTSQNLPSAQHAQMNHPMPDYVTSLYSINLSKGNSSHTEEQVPDAQFSTQAALQLAQKSFQNDLRSPEHSPVASRKKRRSSKSSHPRSPDSTNITPFHQLNTPERLTPNQRTRAPETAGAQMISTQYIIDAVTPFTFSADKKIDSRILSSRNEKSASKKQKTTSFALSSPCEIPPNQTTFRNENDGNSMPQPSPNHHSLLEESQPSGLPMTLTGTTPPTAQDGQGAIPGVDSFNLSKAIAEAGSWLQQSFEIQKDLKQCSNSKGARSPADPGRIAVALEDNNK